MPDDVMSWTVIGDPVPKARPRLGRYGAYTPARTRLAEKAVADGFRARYPDWEPNRTDGFAVNAVFYCATYRRVDVDNLLKTVLDGCNGVVWGDDVQVVEVAAYRYLGCTDPSTYVTVWPRDGYRPPRTRKKAT